MISVSSSGSFDNLELLIQRTLHKSAYSKLESYGAEGVAALKAATPVDSRLTADSWGYKVVRENRRYSIVWTNSNVIDGVPVAILIQYGHANRDGTRVEGRDFINPALHSLFDKIADNVWKEVTANA